MGIVERLIVFPELCTGCRTCELICSFTKEKVINPKLARIRVISKWPDYNYPSVCHQCIKAPCLESCPSKAITKDPTTGAIKVDEEKCIGCGACIKACPFGAVKLHPDKGIAIICDLCGGDPTCVKFCVTGALKFGNIDFLARKRGESTASAIMPSLTKIAQRAMR